MSDAPSQTRRKIDPSRGLTLGDGSPNDNDRVEIGPTQLAFDEWAAAGLDLPDLGRMRRQRWEKLTAALVARDMQDQLARLITACELLVYPGVGHTPRWEDPSRFASDVAAFAERLTL